jgi:signal peptidase I
VSLNKKVSLNDLFPIISEQLNAGGSASFTIRGNSMEPLLKHGKSVVKIEKPKRALKKYDVIFYRREDGDFILHRIVGIKKDGYICRGDNQISNEYPVKAESVIGIVTEYGKDGKLSKISSFKQRSYAFLRVNTVFILRVFNQKKG